MGLTWPFLLMYESHDMRYTGFRRLTVVNGTPESGCHRFSGACSSRYCLLSASLFSEPDAQLIASLKAR